MRSRERSPQVFWYGIALACTILSGCATWQVLDGTYLNEAKGFKLRLPSSIWTLEGGDEPELLFRHQTLPAGMMVNATCGGRAPSRELHVLGRHLLFGLKEKRVLKTDQTVLAEKEVLQTFVRGTFEGEELLVKSYVIKAEGCVYDLVYFADPEVYAEGEGEFEALVKGFELLGGEEP